MGGLYASIPSTVFDAQRPPTYDIYFRLGTLGVFRLSPGCHHNFELPVSDLAMRKIWGLLGVSGIDSSLDLCVASAFDHAYVKREVHDWQVRRWNAFNIAAQCVTSFLVSIPFAH